MENARNVSKTIEKLLFDFYSKGALFPHNRPSRIQEEDESDDVMSDTEESEDTTSTPDGLFWSWPDSEGILSSTNFFQDEENLKEFVEMFKGNEYQFRRSFFKIKCMKISFPHSENRHDILPPHPSMDDEELNKYLWPDYRLHQNNGSYFGRLWILVQSVFLESDDDEDHCSSVSSDSGEWVNILDIPIQIGSNRCNLAIFRSYLSDPEWKGRVEKYLQEVMHWEYHIPDGGFVVQGKFKRVNIVDGLIMNTMYTVKQQSAMRYGRGSEPITPIRHRAVEVRSVRTDTGISYLRILLNKEKDDKKQSGTDNDNEIFKFYKSYLHVAIDKEFDQPINLYFLILGYGMIVANRTQDDVKNDFFSCVRELSGEDMETMRIVSTTILKVSGIYQRNDIIDILFEWMSIPNKKNIKTSDQKELLVIAHLRKKVLPHCEIGFLENEDDPYIVPSYWAKLRFLSLMVIDLILSVTYKKGTNEYRKDVTDRKDFSYKRWESFGHRIHSLVRGMLNPQFQWSKKKEKKYELNTIDQMRSAGVPRQILDSMNRNQWLKLYRSKGMSKIKKDSVKDGVVDDVPKYNTVAMLDSFRTVKIAARAGSNTSSIRRVHSSQWGQQCPANTPENANIGLNNNMAETCLITNPLTQEERDGLDNILDELDIVTDKDEDHRYLLLVDGCPRGYTDESSYDTLREARRSGNINRGIGIARHYLWSQELPPGIPVIVVRTSSGRPVFPALILDKDLSRYNEILFLGNATSFESLLNNGIVEFLDAYEMCNNAVIAPWIGAVSPDNIVYTHAMIKPGHILSQASNSISFIEHNPAARGTYATIHIKQAIGRPFLHPEDRFDHEANYLNNPEPPLLMTDTLRRILYPPEEYRPEGDIPDKDVGYGRNVNVLLCSFDGNNDDAILISEDLEASGVFDGEHFSITTSDKNIQETDTNTYDWLIDEDTKREIRDASGQGIPDPDFSASIIIPYGDPYTELIPDATFRENETAWKVVGDNLEDTPDGQSLYEIFPGRLYIRYGFTSALRIVYTNGEERIVVPGEGMIEIPGWVIQSKERGGINHQFALVAISKEVYEDNVFDNTYISESDLILEGRDEIWYMSSPDLPIPKTLLPDGTITREGQPVAIRPRRAIVRGDTAIKMMARRSGSDPNSEVLDPRGEREKFEITHGFVDKIQRSTPIKIRSTMPINPIPGNKFAALYAQKGVIGRVIPASEMPKARWYNEIREVWEEMTFDVVFNPLSFPSRMTIGMEYEIFIAGTLKYLFSLTDESDVNLRDLYRTNREGFDEYMNDTYGVVNASDLLDTLSDSTCFIYDNQEKYEKCKELREALGIPPTSMYDVYLPGGEDPSEEVLVDLPGHKGYTQKIETKVACGSVFYVALRHLVDNKRRARGYVGRKDPLTLQPVKGRKRNGGANTGTMETDAYKAHGAGGMLYERMSRVSDYKRFLKCPYCDGLVSKDEETKKMTCMDCDRDVPPNEVIEQTTVQSWHLFRNYAHALGIEIKEQFS